MSKHTPEAVGARAVAATFIAGRTTGGKAHISREELAQIVTAGVHYDRHFSGFNTVIELLKEARTTLYEHGDARYTAPVVEKIEVFLKSASES